MDASYILAEHLVGVKMDDLPAEILKKAKFGIIDTLGVILGASSMSTTLKTIVDMVKDMGGQEESSIIGFGGKVPAYMAAFANGVMAHYLDYDDLHYPLKLHPSASTVCAGLAIAERGCLSGKELLVAVALGQDLIARIVTAASWNQPIRPLWQMSQLCGTFAAAAVSGKLLGFNTEKMVNAFGIALCQAAGTMEVRYSTGVELGGMYVGFASKSGVLSALMSHKGIAGIKNSLEGRAGFFNTYFNGIYDRELLLKDLGTRLEGINIGFKAWPACGSMHNHIDATISLVSEQNIKSEDIEEISIYIDNFAQGLCEPLEERCKPKNTMDARFSLPYTVAVAATYRDVKIKDYTNEGIKNEIVLSLAQKIRPIFEPKFNTVRALPPGKIKIKTKQGDIYSKQVDVPYGHPTKPLTKEKIINKFKECASYSIRPLSENNIQQVIYLIDNLENISNVNQIIKLLS